ncbi:CvfB family protein [Clostridium rectalis]|uniref:CvfB family protein n=1 Tax=Clostridium rectalis TaxID=2040295 RepID=UPI000F631BD5|nr:S1-like domain-containing RNA-binding protein [Clostridium rectalis]
MIKLGDFNELKIARKGAPGYFLDVQTGNTSDDILLPYGNCLDKELEEGQIVNAFIYRDSKDRLIATLKEPLAKVSDIAYLKVLSNTRIGAFLDIGLERDLFVPLKEQRYTLVEGAKYLFYVYVDKTNRLAATTNIEPELEISEEYKVSDEVNAIVYDFYRSENVALAVDGKYKAIMLKNEYFTQVNIGDILKLNVKKIYEDGTLGLTPRAKASEERSKLQDEILKYLNTNNDFMPFNDKSSPEDIKEVFHESKNYFKRALGGLMKKGLIKQDDEGTRLIRK